MGSGGYWLNKLFIQKQYTSNYLLNSKVSNLINPRHWQSHLGTYGHVLLIAGSYGKLGAAILSAKSCLRSGVGLLTIHVPKCGYKTCQISVPKAICSALGTIEGNIKVNKLLLTYELK